MKKYLSFFLILVTGNFVGAQNVAINTTGTVADLSAMLDVSSTSSGLLIPRMTSVNMNAISSPATGLIIYNTTMANFYYNQGTPGTPNWVPLSNATSGWYLSGNTLTGTLPASPNEWMGSINGADVIFKTNNTERARIKSTGNFGVNTGSTVNTTLDVNGSVAYREGTALSLANGANNDIAIGANAFFRITGPTAAFSISGFQGVADGRIITLYNTTAQAMTIVNNATSTAANRIYTMSGADVKIPIGPCVITLQYNSTASRWLMVTGNSSSNVSGGPGSSMIYPDGINNITPVLVDYGALGPSPAGYPVTAGKNLYITSIALASGGYSVTVDGTTIAAPRTNQNGTAAQRAYTLAMPIVAGPGSVIAYSYPGPGTVAATFSGFEVDATVTPVSSFINSTTTYTVPAGKTLYIMNIYNAIGASISIDPTGGGTFYGFFTAYSNYSAGGDGLFNQILQPIIIGPGGKIKSDDAGTTRCAFNGYLK